METLFGFNKNKKMITRVTLILPAVTFSTLIFVGCGSKNLNVPTIEVSGRIVDAQSKPLTGGAVEFHRTDGKMLNAMGEIKEDGSFVLITSGKSGRKNGIAPGSYNVVVSRLTEDPQVTQNIFLEKPVVINDTVASNELVLIADMPLKWSFTSSLPIEKIIVGLNKKFRTIRWQEKEKPCPQIVGFFRPDESSTTEASVVLSQLSSSSFEIEDWASVFSNRGVWPEGLDPNKLMTLLRAKDIKKVE